MRKHLRYVMVCFCLLFAGSMAAESVIKFVPAETKESATETSVSKGGVTLTVSGGMMNRDDNYRTYKSQTLTVSSTVGKITKIAFASTVDDPSVNYGAGYSECNTGSFTAEGANGLWTGEANEVVLTAGNHQVRATYYEVTIDGEASDDDPVDPVVEAKELYKEDFTAGQGKFTIEDKMVSEGLSYVWTQDSRYGMKASAYVGGSDLAAESWLLSPEIDLKKATGTSITFSHALNFFLDIERAKSEATVWVKVNGGDWAQLEGVTYPGELSWTFIDCTIDTKAYDGKKVQFGFKYVSTEEKAGTWEIKNFVVKGQGEASVAGDDQPEEVKSINTAEALALIAELADGKTTQENYYVSGVVVGIEEINLEYGNATFNIADDANDGAEKQLTVYRAYGLDNAKIEDESYVNIGDVVVVFGKLQRYVKNGVIIPEVSKGYIYAIKNKTGIDGVKSISSPTPAYNLKGQKVDANYRGIVVKDGKKFLVR